MSSAEDLYVGEVEPFSGSGLHVDMLRDASEIVVFNASLLRDRIAIRQVGGTIIVTLNEPDTEPEIGF